MLRGLVIATEKNRMVISALDRNARLNDPQWICLPRLLYDLLDYSCSFLAAGEDFGPRLWLMHHVSLAISRPINER